VTGYFGSFDSAERSCHFVARICEGSRRSSNTGGGAASPAPLTPTASECPEALRSADSWKSLSKSSRRRRWPPLTHLYRPVEGTMLESRTAIPERPGQQIRQLGSDSPVSQHTPVVEGVEPRRKVESITEVDVRAEEPANSPRAPSTPNRWRNQDSMWQLNPKRQSPPCS